MQKIRCKQHIDNKETYKSTNPFLKGFCVWDIVIWSKFLDRKSGYDFRMKSRVIIKIWGKKVIHSRLIIIDNLIVGQFKIKNKYLSALCLKGVLFSFIHSIIKYRALWFHSNHIENILTQKKGRFHFHL